MKTFTITLILFLTMGGVGFSQVERNDLASNNIKLSGWAKEFLDRQETGLTGYPEQSGFPFNTGMWTEQMDFTDREFPGGSGWWPYEQTGYYLDGALRCGYMNNSEELIKRVKENISYVLENADSDGTLHAGNVKDDWWPLVVFMRMLFEEYKVTGDAKILEGIKKHYQSVYKKAESFNLPKDSGFSTRKLLHIEHLCKLYDLTNNKWYLEIAEKLYNKFQANADVSQTKELLPLTAKGMAQGMRPSGHSVTYHEFLKLPVILFYYTQKEEYKLAFERGFELLKQHHELADGLSSSVEGLEGKAVDMAHELCNVSDFNWTAGWALLATGNVKYADKMEKVMYNAGFSSVTADFKAHQYYGNPNMPISSDMSSFYNDKSGWGFAAKGRLCYRPGHDTECCSGNVHRMFPTFVNRAVITEPNGVKIALYLPSIIDVKIKNEQLKFTQETSYPFNHTIDIKIENAPSKRINFDFRIPGWSESYVIKLNGHVIQQGTDNTFFESIKRKFKKGDILNIAFKTSPKIDDRDKGIAIMYGPLVYSYPLEAKTRIITADDGRKCSPEFPAYEFLPKFPHSWAYSLSANIKSSDIEIIKTNMESYPWDYGKSPLKLKVSARAVKNWKLKNNVAASEFPAVLDVGEAVDTLVLEPMGGTLLRITEFPKSN